MRRALLCAVYALALSLLYVPSRADSMSVSTPGAVRALGQSHIPVVLVSSGTMGNNGALSGITAVARAYPAAYVYLPENAISSGSAAGRYYAVFSSSTAATVYNNTYSGTGTPTIPASPTAFSTTGPGAYTQTTAMVAAYSVTIPGGVIGPNGGLHISGVVTNNNSGNIKNSAVTLGGQNVAQTNNTTVRTSALAADTINQGNQTVQVAANYWGYNQAVGAYPNTATVDTSADQPLVVQMHLPNATDTISLENITVVLVPGVN